MKTGRMDERKIMEDRVGKKVDEMEGEGGRLW